MTELVATFLLLEIALFQMSGKCFKSSMATATLFSFPPAREDETNLSCMPRPGPIVAVERVFICAEGAAMRASVKEKKWWMWVSQSKKTDWRVKKAIWVCQCAPARLVVGEAV